MNEVVASVIRWVLRLVVVAMGAVLFLSLLAAALVLAGIWLLRALWARLTGRPVTPWVMRMDPRTGWSTVYRSTARWTAQRSDQQRRADAPAPDVTDVVPREIR
ncbi:MAG: hypothetical protein JSR14_07230 [Proteobacteria bacterium]|nr:hypothetical protein [Pseudomonadota bacterium]